MTKTVSFLLQRWPYYSISPSNSENIINIQTKTTHQSLFVDPLVVWYSSKRLAEERCLFPSILPITGPLLRANFAAWYRCRILCTTRRSGTTAKWWSLHTPWTSLSAKASPPLSSLKHLQRPHGGTPGWGTSHCGVHIHSRCRAGLQQPLKLLFFKTKNIIAVPVPTKKLTSWNTHYSLALWSPITRYSEISFYRTEYAN